MKRVILSLFLILPAFVAAANTETECWSQSIADICYQPLAEQRMEYWQVSLAESKTDATLLVLGAGGPGAGYTSESIKTYFSKPLSSESYFKQVFFINLANTGENFPLNCYYFTQCLERFQSLYALSTEFMVRQLEELINTWDLQTYYLFGVSYSGRTAAMTAASTQLNAHGVIYDSAVAMLSDDTRQEISAVQLSRFCELSPSCMAEYPEYQQMIDRVYDMTSEERSRLEIESTGGYIRAVSFQLMNAPQLMEVVQLMIDHIEQRDGVWFNFEFQVSELVKKTKRQGYPMITVNPHLNLFSLEADALARGESQQDSLTQWPLFRERFLQEKAAAPEVIVDLQRLAQTPAWLYRCEVDTQIADAAFEQVARQHLQFSEIVEPGICHGVFLRKVLAEFSPNVTDTLAAHQNQ